MSLLRGGAWWCAFAGWVARPAVSPVMMRIATLIDRPLMRLTAGRVRLSFVIPMVLLRVPGRRTRQLRDVPLLYVPADDSVLLVASNAGQGRLPAWFLNLRECAQAGIVRDGRSERMRVTVLDGDARAQAWQAAIAVYPGYGPYQARTPYLIPVVRLDPIAG